MPIPDDPTWQEIQDGMAAVVATGKAAKQAAAAAKATIKTQEQVIRQAEVDERVATREYRDWEKAIFKKLNTV